MNTRFLRSHGVCFLILFLMCGWGCSEMSLESDRLDNAIMYGELDTNPDHRAVVFLELEMASGTSMCTGTLIAPDVVMTAAHCTNRLSASDVTVVFGTDLTQGYDYLREASEVLTHPSYSGLNLSNDIALVRLRTPAPAEIQPIPYLPDHLGLTPSDEGAEIEFSGFGLDENGNYQVKKRVDGTVALVCEGPRGCSLSGAGSVAVNAFAYYQPTSVGGPCSGDSGGPAFLIRDGREYVVGITSYGDNACTNYGVSTNASAFSNFIEEFLGVAQEDCTNGQDDDEDGLVDCDDPGCRTHPACMEQCSNQRDDDGDGLVDCADPDCVNDSGCPDSCEMAVSIGCGDQIDASTATSPSKFESYGCSGDYAWQGPEIAYRIDVPPQTLAQAVLQIDSGVDLDLFVIEGSRNNCRLNDCLGASWNASGSETVDFAMPAEGAYLIVDAERAQVASDFRLSLVCEDTEICGNTRDDDGDGDVDCGDRDCVDYHGCIDEICDNQIDDDGDGLSDCADEECVSYHGCIDEICGNQIDNDGDGLIDCDDEECLTHHGCIDEVCDNQIDDDGDGLSDCADEECVSYHGCIDEVCDNQYDDDGDGLSDCADEECVSYHGCIDEVCDNQYDDDGDGLSDCADEECVSYHGCIDEVCDNQYDDDGDGLSDCADEECYSYHGCIDEVCDNQTDDDGDGLPDCADEECHVHHSCIDEVCDNGLDDDADGFSDCHDSECEQENHCADKEICDNAIDDNKNGKTDCDDKTCRDHPNCIDEICDNQIDDNADGLVDCLDADCAEHTNCISERCDNLVDDDGDGLTDCHDIECFTHAACEDTEFCENGFDDNQNGLVDCKDVACAGHPVCASSGCQTSGNHGFGIVLVLYFGLLLLVRRRGRAAR